jgi:hypothetical protein
MGHHLVSVERKQGIGTHSACAFGHSMATAV